MELYNIFLDDTRCCPEGYTLVRSAEECMEVLSTDRVYKHISLDHDLGSKSLNGYAVVEYMIENKIYAERITVHSANAGGGKRMYESLLRAREQGVFPSHVKVYLRPMPLFQKQI
ncbi:hypothetical protein B0H94_101252 [Salsuginibacillus halophilus]|uniref:Cyclic-phosphate processing Receiver domain-containing protein n=1 Tax=Salsuginibacillus halophilus TaxID=517424 RepID=A0A2P8HYM6_9BACI|nr:cyclic-phosphate processing receiver domain-containing protein [Salsuginibacillus halophilus]PSL51338.1 hypothetical protein B0H94_101252 [Salsuginibacillus halophilus]